MAGRSFERLFAVAGAQYGELGTNAVAAWQNLVVANATSPERERLRRVNAFFNQRLLFRDDWNVWGQADYWATPLEALVRGSGDCEDFSIAKFVTLRELGIARDKLRLIYVRAELGSGGPVQAHMVLGYYANPGAEPLLLDNLVAEILPASQRNDLTPVFSFNDKGLWAGGQQAASDPTARLSRWRRLLLRLVEQGFR